jgi:hypothetical protein
MNDIDEGFVRFKLERLYFPSLKYHVYRPFSLFSATLVPHKLSPPVSYLLNPAVSPTSLELRRRETNNRV